MGFILEKTKWVQKCFFIQNFFHTYTEPLEFSPINWPWIGLIKLMLIYDKHV